MLIFLSKRLIELVKDDEHRLKKYMLILETLSGNRDLKEKLKKAEEMLRDTRYEDLPSYELGMERGVSQGISQANIKNAIIMVKEFKIDPKEVAKKLKLSLDELLKHLN